MFGQAVIWPCLPKQQCSLTYLSKVLSLGQFYQIGKIGGVLTPKSLALAKNWLSDQETSSFLLILTKSVEPIFQSAEPNLQHTTLEEHCQAGNREKRKLSQPVSVSIAR